MKLRDFKKEDAPIVASWIRSEEELYKWSADRFNKYPLSGDDINENYAPQLETGRFFPLTVVDDNEEVIGHFIIRYPREDDDSSVRFGFVILNAVLRGKGLGKEMLRLGIEYVKTRLTVSRIDLGVFENNESAMHCYESAGFIEYGRRKCDMPIGTWECIDMDIWLDKQFIQLDESYIPQMADLYKMAFGGEPWNDDWSDGEQLLEYIREISGGYHPLNYGLFSGGKLCAVSIGQIKHWWQGTEYYLDELFVDPDLQGQGLGSLLLRMIEKDIQNRGISGIFLQTENDKPAYAFYQKRDFKELTGHVSFYKELKDGNNR